MTPGFSDQADVGVRRAGVRVLPSGVARRCASLQISLRRRVASCCVAASSEVFG
jgi:hypothetical protein